MRLDNPIENYSIAANHIGDIDVYKGEIFLVVEWFVDGEGKDVQITEHDAKNLAFKRSFSFEPSLGPKELSGITLWMVSWVGGESGKHLYEYDMKI